jgi:hypothetical protein
MAAIDPVETARVTRLVPNIVKGSQQGRRWDEEPSVSTVVEEPNPLLDYFAAHTDGRGIFKWRHYFGAYHRHLGRFRGRPVNVVEVGVFAGGSLQMWRDYFGDECQVFGVDIVEECRTYEGDGIRVFVGDQGDRSFWRAFREQVPHVDVLIDDGGHLVDQQVVTLEEMLPHMAPGGVYICEDIVNNEFAAYLMGLQMRMNWATRGDGDGQLNITAAGIQRHVASMHLYPFLAVIEKAVQPVDRYSAYRMGTQWQPLPTLSR